MTPVPISTSVHCMVIVSLPQFASHALVVYNFLLDQRAQDTVRDKASGRGLLFPDTFAEERLQFLPPATGALLVIFARNHNFICERLLQINERKQWADPVPADPRQRAQQDEEIFQTARLVKSVPRF